MYMFMMPRMIRKAAETAEAMMAPTLLKVLNRVLMAEAVAATVMEVMMTMLAGPLEVFGKEFDKI